MRNIDVNHCPIFVSSSDSYSDIWPSFFALFKREWPDYKGTIYLNTQETSFNFPGLNIICTQVGHNMRFGATFKAGMNKIADDHFLLLMIDYFFERKVDVKALQHFYTAFLNANIDSLTLSRQCCPGARPVPDLPECREAVAPGGEASFSFQIAFWKKGSIGPMIGDWETPWFAEYFGCRRFNILKPRIWFLSDTTPKPIEYDCFGVLHGGGKWLESAINKIDLSGIPLDIVSSKQIRGVYVESTFPRLVRIPGELLLLPYRIKSMWSVLRLKINSR